MLLTCVSPFSNLLIYIKTGLISSYLKTAAQLHVGHPMTKLLSGKVLPSQTSSKHPAVHTSHKRTWAFCLKWLADLTGDANTHTHALILIIHKGINRMHRCRKRRGEPKEIKVQQQQQLTWLWRSRGCRWRGRGVCPEFASQFLTERVREGEKFCQSLWWGTGWGGRTLDWQESQKCLCNTQNKTIQSLQKPTEWHKRHTAIRWKLPIL